MEDFNMVWMKEALDLAEKAAQEDEVPVGAVIVRNGQKIAQGYNKKEQFQNPIAHAEIVAIQEAARVLGSWRLTDCSLYVTLEPCPMCLAASQQARLKEIFFGAKDPKGGGLSLGYALHEDSRINHRFPATALEIPECGEILSRFFARKRSGP